MFCSDLYFFKEPSEYLNYLKSEFCIKKIPIYYLPQYIFSWKNYEKADFCVLEIKEKKMKAILPLLVKYIDSDFKEGISAYGYSGFYSDLAFSTHSLLEYEDGFRFEFLVEFFKKNNFLDLFIRNSPFLDNSVFFPNTCNEFDRNTVVVELEDWRNQSFPPYFKSKTKWPVKYALRNKLYSEFYNIQNYKDDDLRKFSKIYEEVMKKNQADLFYHFPYQFLKEQFFRDDRSELLIIKKEEEIIGGAFFLIDEKYVHYYLSALDYKYAKYQISDFIIYSAIRRYEKLGKQYINLGGGRTSSDEDKLLKFKARYGKKTEKYFTSKIIVNDKKYNLMREKYKIANSKYFSITDALKNKTLELRE